MATKIYNSLDHKVYFTFNDNGTSKTFAGQGEPDADFISVTYDNEAVQAMEGAKGDVQFSQKKASLGSLSASFQWGSSTNDNLNYVFRNQQKGMYLEKVEVKRITDVENVIVWTSSRAMIAKIPDYSVGSQANDRSWDIKLEGLFPGEFTTPS